MALHASIKKHVKIKNMYSAASWECVADGCHITPRVMELGSKKSLSHPPTLLRHCVHNKRCNVLRYLYCGYGVSSPVCKTFGERRSEHRASQALQREFEKTKSTEIFYLAVARLHTSAAERKDAVKIFRFCHKGTRPRKLSRRVPGASEPHAA